MMFRSDKIDTSVPAKGKKLILLFICLLLILMLPIICFSQNGDSDSFFTRGHLFWWHILWFECIFLAFWHSFTGEHVSRLITQRQQTGGANAALVYLWYKLGFSSFIFWCISIFIPASSDWQTVPFLLQGVVIILFLLAIFLTPQTKNLQMQGIDPLPDDLLSPSQLADKLTESILKDHSIEVRNEIKRIAEKIRYSIPQAGQISSSSKYRELVGLIFALDNSLDDAYFLAALQNISTLANQIALDCKQ